MAEWRIGEIRQIDNEWYQCIKQPEDFMGEVCKICAFQGTENCDVDECSDSFRSDKQDVIFKKLEKVGEPYVYKGILIQPYRKATDALICNWNPDYFLLEDRYSNSDIIGIEIKQNKEDMEMKKVFMNGDDRDYLLDRLEAILHDTHCQQYKDEICEAFSKYIIAENVSDLKPFDLSAAKVGKSVCTRDGRKARIICFDLKNGEYPIVAAIGNDSSETLLNYTINGEIVKGNYKSGKDLMMLPEKKSGWVNVYYDNGASHRGCRYIYDTKEQAVKEAGSDYITTVKIEWEE